MEVAIIGAGVSGLFAIKSCIDEGLLPQCFEKTDQLGGTWVYRDQYQPGDPAGVYRGLRSNSSVFTHEASDFPSHVVSDIYPSREDHLHYLQTFSSYHRLDYFIQFNTEVITVVPEGDFWKITWSQSGGPRRTQVFHAVLVCSGRFIQPSVPKIDGIDAFKGRFLTANQFKHNKQAEVLDKRVLIVGNSITAADIAAIAAETAQQVYISIGRGCSLISPSFGRVPFDTLTVTRAATRGDVQTRTRQMLRWNMSNTFQEQEAYGISTHGADILTRPFLLTTNDLTMHVRSGRVKIRPALVKLGEGQASFEDGQIVKIDTVIVATGYDISFPFLPKGLVADTVNDLELYRLMWPLTTREPNLAFVGCARVLGSFPPLVELQARWAVRVIRGECRLPDKQTMRTEIKKRKQALVERYGKCSAQPDTSVLEFQDFMAKEIGALPTWWHYLPTNPRLAMVLRNGPAFPCTYRLTGPHAWSGAASRTLELYDRWSQLLPERDPEYGRWIAKALATGLIIYLTYRLILKPLFFSTAVVQEDTWSWLPW